MPTDRKLSTLRTTSQGYDINNFIVSTQAQFKISPITPRAATTTPDPDEGVLRNLEESKLFKEFITTMFGSEEVKEYLDQFESDTNTEEEATTIDTSRVASVKPTTGPTTAADIEYELPQDPKGSVRMVTTIDNFDEFKEKGEEDDRMQTVETLDENMSEEEQAEESIAKLINDIDIQELLASETSEIFSKNEHVIKSNEPTNEKKKYAPKMQKVQVDKENIELALESVSESREESGDEYKYNSEYQPIKNKVSKKISTNAKKDPRKETKKNIAYKDATFRQNSTSLNIFSQNDLLRLLNEAVAEAAESAKSKHHSR